MEEKYCGNCLYARPLPTTTDTDLIECKYEGPRLPNHWACDKWASRCIDEAHEEGVFDTNQLKPQPKLKEEIEMSKVELLKELDPKKV